MEPRDPVIGKRVRDPSFPRVTPHRLRHVVAGLIIQAGANVKMVSAQLGHASAKQTLDTYVHLWHDGLDRMMQSHGADVVKLQSRAGDLSRLCWLNVCFVLDSCLGGKAFSLEGWMKRHIAWLLSCGLLVGCGAAPPPIDAPSAPTPAPNESNSDHAPSSSSPVNAAYAPAAFNFKSGVLEIGDFDPYTLGDNIFDPCTEISPEEFAAAGFDNVEPLPEEYAGLAKGLSSCNFTAHPQLPVEGISQNNASRSEVRKQVDLLEQYRSQLLPEIFVYGPKSGFGTHCYAQLDTARGGIVSIASGWDGVNSMDEVCKTAVENLENLYQLNTR